MTSRSPSHARAPRLSTPVRWAWPVGMSSGMGLHDDAATSKAAFEHSASSDLPSWLPAWLTGRATTSSGLEPPVGLVGARGR